MSDVRISRNVIEMSHDRREFLKRVSIGAAGLSVARAPFTGVSQAAGVQPGNSTVSFVTGNDRREMMFRVLEPLKDEIVSGIRGKQVIIKVNLFGLTILSSTHVDAVRGVLDFLKPIYPKPVIVAESKPMANFESRNMFAIPREYNARLLDFNDLPANGLKTKVLWIIDHQCHPRPINVPESYLDPNNYIISLARMKVHNDVVVTLTMKNLVMACPVEHYHQKKAAGRNERAFMHAVGLNRKFINFNIFLVAQKVRPQLAVIDGFEGVERNGPHGEPHGFPVEHGVALAGTDPIAVDRVGVELMGMNFDDVGYLTYCARSGLGQGDLSRINIIGPDPRNHIIVYRLHNNIEGQLNWKEGLVLDW